MLGAEEPAKAGRPPGGERSGEFGLSQIYQFVFFQFREGKVYVTVTVF
jgi:hypothetical protein